MIIFFPLFSQIPSLFLLTQFYIYILFSPFNAPTAELKHVVQFVLADHSWAQGPIGVRLMYLANVT